jgi:hypothetical protein
LESGTCTWNESRPAIIITDGERTLKHDMTLRSRKGILLSRTSRRLPFAICHLPFAICHLTADSELSMGEYRRNTQAQMVLLDGSTSCAVFHTDEIDGYPLTISNNDRVELRRQKHIDRGSACGGTWQVSSRRGNPKTSVCWFRLVGSSALRSTIMTAADIFRQYFHKYIYKWYIHVSLGGVQTATNCHKLPDDE